jgi:hypothetical protein
VIIRPKSTSDLLWLRKKKLHQQHETPFTIEPLELRIQQELSAIFPQKELQDDKDFEVWADGLEDKLEAATLEKYMFATSLAVLTVRTYRAVLQARLHTCDTILSQTSILLSTLNNLRLGFSSVADQTASFQSHCDNLVQEEVKRSPL